MRRALAPFNRLESSNHTQSSADFITKTHTFLFTMGKFLIGLYIGSSAVASSYGAAGALIVALLWIYYSAQIFLLGAEFTKVYAHHHGSQQPVPHKLP
jgi:membrane protein